MSGRNAKLIRRAMRGSTPRERRAAYKAYTCLPMPKRAHEREWAGVVAGSEEGFRSMLS